MRPDERGGGHDALRAWLEYLAQTAIDWLDALDADDADREPDDREDDERESVRTREDGWR